MQTLLRAEAVVDLDAASNTTAFTMKTPGAGNLSVSAVFGRFEEAVASGGFSTTAGVASLEVEGVEVGTWSTGVSATARAVGDTVFITPNATAKAKLDNIEFDAGTTIALKTKTQGAGGTVTGTIRFYLPLSLNLE